jgi:hypothetical protein
MFGNENLVMDVSTVHTMQGKYLIIFAEITILIFSVSKQPSLRPWNSLIVVRVDRELLCVLFFGILWEILTQCYTSDKCLKDNFNMALTCQIDDFFFGAERIC